MTDNGLPPNVGPEITGDSAYSLVCAYTGPMGAEPMCGAPATIHLRWDGLDGAETNPSTLACDRHASIARFGGAVDEHPVAGSACAMPGSLWSYSSPSFCFLDDGLEHLQLTTHFLADPAVVHA